MQQYKTHALPEGVSDHCPFVVEMIQTQEKKGKAFRYCNMWSKHPDFLHIVAEGWAMQVEGCKIYQVVKRLKALKQKLRILHKRNFSYVINEANKDREEVYKLQAMLQQTPLDQNLQQQEKYARDKFMESSLMAENFLMQRSKATWIRLRDDNTKYFFSIIKQRRLVQSQLGLIKGVTAQEIKKAMFSINVNKSPGPDGYGVGFYRDAWKVVGKDITDVVIEFSSNG
ncbi:uncharacterized protein [Nicotiana tomentosiformis]|uniref:uncharacterized protein n=1 Tax=Nicotiana tomentosiformis TaxID=4098 RepID=UPI00051ACCB4|nr:uncharacterized protein LOC104091459 [Nicotiana tomentosiformis]